MGAQIREETPPWIRRHAVLESRAADRQRRHVEVGRCRAWRRARAAASGVAPSPRAPMLRSSARRSRSAKWSWPAGTAVCVVNTVLQAIASSAHAKVRALGHERAHALENQEGGVPFVDVPDRGHEPHRAERPHAADAEDDLLLDSRRAIAAVEAVRDAAVGGRVLGDVGVEQEQPDMADARLPDLDRDLALGHRHADLQIRGRRRRAPASTGRSAKSASPYVACCSPWLSMVWWKYPWRYSSPTPTKGSRTSLAALQWSPARMPRPPE